jgi:DNA-binding NarL/FixJ family response regulator
VNRRAADQERAQAEAELACLTPRQRDVLVLAAKGYNRFDAGKMLGISFKTIDAHRREMRQVLEMSLIEAAVLATRAGWV